MFQNWMARRGLKSGKRLKAILKCLEMKIVDRLTSKKVRKKWRDIVKHKEDPQNYQSVLEKYEKEVQEKISNKLGGVSRGISFLPSAVLLIILWLICFRYVTLYAPSLQNSIISFILFFVFIPLIWVFIFIGISHFLGIEELSKDDTLFFCIFAIVGWPLYFFMVIAGVIGALINSLQCIFSDFDELNKEADINKYHNWIKVGEHKEAVAWSATQDITYLVADFKCSVCGKKAAKTIEEI